MNPFKNHERFNGSFPRSAAVLMMLKMSISLAISLPANAIAHTKQDTTDKQVWAVSMDNDLFVPVAANDRDFTGGMALTYSGRNGTQKRELRYGLLGGFDRVLNVQGADSWDVITAAEVGFYGFTPDEIETPDVLYHDRPYASLVYMSMSRQYPVRRS